MADASIKVLGGKINPDGSRLVTIVIDDHVEKDVQVPSNIVLPDEMVAYLRRNAEHARNDQFYKTLEGLKLIDVQTGAAIQSEEPIPVVAAPAPADAPAPISPAHVSTPVSGPGA